MCEIFFHGGYKQGCIFMEGNENIFGGIQLYLVLYFYLVKLYSVFLVNLLLHCVISIH